MPPYHLNFYYRLRLLPQLSDQALVRDKNLIFQDLTPSLHIFATSLYEVHSHPLLCDNYN